MKEIVLSFEDFMTIFEGFGAVCDEYSHAPQIQKIYEPVREKYQELYDSHYRAYCVLVDEKMRQV